MTRTADLWRHNIAPIERAYLPMKTPSGECKTLKRYRLTRSKASDAPGEKVPKLVYMRSMKSPLFVKFRFSCGLARKRCSSNTDELVRFSLITRLTIAECIVPRTWATTSAAAASRLASISMKWIAPSFDDDVLVTMRPGCPQHQVWRCWPGCAYVLSASNGELLDLCFYLCYR